jgi:Ca2+-binding EF-hand superfamily protein
MNAGSLYSHKTRLGNWQEEIAIGEAKLENFRKRSETGNLALRKQEIKMQRCCEIVPHSYAEDGLVKFGDSVIFSHDMTGAILSCDPFEEMVQGQERYLVSASNTSNVTPLARNTFRVSRPPKHLRDAGDDESSPYLRYGQSFLLEVSESLLISQSSSMLNPMLYLASCKKNERTATRTNRQMVYLSPRCDADTIWQCTVPSKGKSNASERFLALGQEVNTSDVALLTHRQTNMLLTCDKKNQFESEFGIESECYCDRDSYKGKLSLMVSEFKGESTAMTLAKPDKNDYNWRIITSNDPASTIDARDPLPPTATIEQILKEISVDVRSRGVDGYWNLRAFFLALDKKAMNIGKIDREDLKDAMAAWGTSVEPRYLDKLIEHFDTARTGLIQWAHWIAFLRTSSSPNGLSDDRQRIVMDAFSIIDEAGTGSVTPDDLARCFNAQDHPLCTPGADLSPKDALTHMYLSLSKLGRVPAEISYAQFADYFEDLSACCDDDSYFESILKNMWIA